MLILFKPWRNVLDLKIVEETWLESFIKFETLLESDSPMRTFIRNVDYLKIAEKEVEDYVISKNTSFKNVYKELKMIL